MRDLVEKMVAEITDTASLTVSEIRKPLAGVVYEGPITINDLGATVQDIGNGVGILHKQSALGAVQLGEVLGQALHVVEGVRARRVSAVSSSSSVRSNGAGGSCGPRAIALGRGRACSR